MMMFAEFTKFGLQAITANVVGILLIIIIWLNLLKKSNNTIQKYIYVAMCVVNIVQCVVEPITVVIDGQIFTANIIISKILNTLLFLNNIIFVILWVLYAYVKINHKVKTFNPLVFIPAILVVLGIIVNIFVPIIFEITPENVYVRKSMFYVTLGITYFYLILGLIYGSAFRRKLNEYNFLPVFTFILPVFVASLVQILLPGVSLLWVGSAVGLAAAYISSLDEKSSVDPLSKLFSRYYFDIVSNDIAKMVANGNNVYGIMIDIDNFKKINDEHGHLVGDDAIINVGNILRNVIGINGRVFRYGGDEFIIILSVDKIEMVEKIVEAINIEAQIFNKVAQKEYSLEFSYGYTAYLIGEKPTDFVARMDEKMYNDKKAKKIGE